MEGEAGKYEQEGEEEEEEGVEGLPLKAMGSVIASLSGATQRFAQWVL